MIKNIVRRIATKIGYKVEKIPRTEKDLAEDIIKKGREIAKKISPNLSVLNGVFKELRYPSLDITEAALVPKILGSYESQLHNFLMEVFEDCYSDIIDVGCAEGYYAVGFAKRMPNAVIHAFDINEKDLTFCKKMAQLNEVKNLTYSSFCSPSTLIDFDFRNKGLVFCDCEGYELELFTTDVINSFSKKKVDVLVEMHDVLMPGISSELILRFKETHDIRIISTKNKKNTVWKGLNELSESEKLFATFEHRGGINKDVYMEWAFFTVKEK